MMVQVAQRTETYTEQTYGAVQSPQVSGAGMNQSVWNFLLAQTDR